MERNYIFSDIGFTGFAPTIDREFEITFEPSNEWLSVSFKEL